MKNLKVSLAWQILLAMVLGILLGSYLHYHSDSREWLIANLLSPAGDIFIHLIKMIVVPIVISTLIVGIAGRWRCETARPYRRKNHSLF
ncbi:glutamate/aspartate:proton symporter [Salmonella enterica subsp. arizonae]|uniref:Glutamate/aspartate:proton symporter n=1 Tax=Salmonella enterica subsp. arizonae TaxID=59203 RepID=A0A379T4F7_SALER|nr:glutamate/aspartate:proton symporter [Salmonella enterica subsp. arizonae]